MRELWGGSARKPVQDDPGTKDKPIDDLVAALGGSLGGAVSQQDWHGARLLLWRLSEMAAVTPQSAAFIAGQVCDLSITVVSAIRGVSESDQTYMKKVSTPRDENLIQLLLGVFKLVDDSMSIAKEQDWAPLIPSLASFSFWNSFCFAEESRTLTNSQTDQLVEIRREASSLTLAILQHSKTNPATLGSLFDDEIDVRKSLDSIFSARDITTQITIVLIFKVLYSTSSKDPSLKLVCDVSRDYFNDKGLSDRFIKFPPTQMATRTFLSNYPQSYCQSVPKCSVTIAGKNIFRSSWVDFNQFDLSFFVSRGSVGQVRLSYRRHEISLQDASEEFPIKLLVNGDVDAALAKAYNVSSPCEVIIGAKDKNIFSDLKGPVRAKIATRVTSLLTVKKSVATMAVGEMEKAEKPSCPTRERKSIVQIRQGIHCTSNTTDTVELDIPTKSTLLDGINLARRRSTSQNILLNLREVDHLQPSQLGRKQEVTGSPQRRSILDRTSLIRARSTTEALVLSFLQMDPNTLRSPSPTTLATVDPKGSRRKAVPQSGQGFKVPKTVGTSVSSDELFGQVLSKEAPRKNHDPSSLVACETERLKTPDVHLASRMKRSSEIAPSSSGRQLYPREDAPHEGPMLKKKRLGSVKTSATVDWPRIHRQVEHSIGSQSRMNVPCQGFLRGIKASLDEKNQEIRARQRHREKHLIESVRLGCNDVIDTSANIFVQDVRTVIKNELVNSRVFPVSELDTNMGECEPPTIDRCHQDGNVSKYIKFNKQLISSTGNEIREAASELQRSIERPSSNDHMIETVTRLALDINKLSEDL